METHRRPATLRLLCALVLAFAVIAGPCQACFDPPAKSSAHGCCPSQKNAPQHQHNSSCSDVQVAVEQGKAGMHEFDAAVAPALAAAHEPLAPLAGFERVQTSLTAPPAAPVLVPLRV